MNDSWITKISSSPRIKKYSQAGEEGYISFIMQNIDTSVKFLVDIGASDGYSNSNTRLFIEQGASSILIDGNSKGNSAIKQEWVTRENVVDMLRNYDCPLDFDLLSLDLDGNDYDIIDSLLKVYRPKLVICEINGCIPLGIAKKIKYNPAHTFKQNDYYGFSFSAANVLAETNGYKVIFQNDGLNVYLLRKDLLVNSESSISVKFEHLQYHPHFENGEWEILQS